MKIILKILIVVAICKLSYQQSCTKETNKDIEGNDLPSQNGKQEEECCDLCSQVSGCKAYAWNDFKGGTCWFKSVDGPLIDKDGVSVGIISGGDSPSDGIQISQPQFENAVTSCGFPKPSADKYKAFIKGLPKGSITTIQEAAMIFANVIHESGGLQFKRELACIKDGCPESYRTPGCDAPGQFYYGRGYLQLSWCFNYKPCSTDLFGDDRLVKNPDLVASDEQISWDSALWFWKKNVHSVPGVSEGKFGVTTRAINGGLECDGPNKDQARKRYAFYGKIRAAWGLPGAGIENGCYN